VDSELKVLQEALDRILAQDPELAAEIQDTQPRVAAEMPSLGAPEVAGARLDPVTLKGELGDDRPEEGPTRPDSPKGRLHVQHD